MHSSIHRLVAAMTAAMFFSQCSSFQSYPAQTSGDLPEAVESKQGLYYFLPKAQVSIEGKYVDIKGSDNKTVIAREYQVTVQKQNVPDGSAPIFLEATENAMYDEDTVFEVKGGLLQNANAKPTDQTPQIITTVVGMAIDVAKIAARGTSMGILRHAEDQKHKLKPVTEFAVSFDPLASGSVEYERAVAKMKEAGFQLASSGRADRAAPDSSEQEKELRKAIETLQENRYWVKKTFLTESNLPAPAKAYRDGVAFRKPSSLVLTVSRLPDYAYMDSTVPFKKKKEEKKPGEEDKANAEAAAPEEPPLRGAAQYVAALTVPDKLKAPSFMPMRRGFMTKRETSITFENGEPTKFDLKAPSPVLGFVKLPAGIVKMVGDAIPALVQIKRDSAKSDITTQTELIKAQSELIKAQNELNGLKASSSTQ